MDARNVFAAIEAGGTKFMCAVGTGPLEILAETRIPTTSPEETLGAVQRFFLDAQIRFGAIKALGIGTFGPVDLDPRSPTWGHLLATPKPGWADADLVGAIRQTFACPIAIDTDVNAAALAEQRLGAGRGVRSVVYVTVGTGIGGGVAVDDAALPGFLHPEMGHLRVRRDPRDAAFAGICPFHGDCLEGLASGPAIQARWGSPLDQLDDALGAQSIIGGYLGELAAAIALLFSAGRVVFGGGVMSCEGLLPIVRSSMARLLNGYLPLKRAAPSLDEYIVAPGLGTRSGIAGSMLLGMRADAAAKRSIPRGERSIQSIP